MIKRFPVDKITQTNPTLRNRKVIMILSFETKTHFQVILQRKYFRQKYVIYP